ncbi:hypothetical protein [Celeribacter halophilus]|uniref:Uncharacterized protein n=1 Tax=Celeribacter halophilus TaxID=576117 RepID=A0A1I3WLA0_9RHOB|nr:hypothetical protein [Celeribacter halophilus]PZX06063.1 hypothetical protein LX82_03417 [Celeribacter halophilus]SFK07959.1 hypothetical protein SAMN04488138_1273 [Celeribacter halophilus]
MTFDFDKLEKRENDLTAVPLAESESNIPQVLIDTLQSFDKSDEMPQIAPWRIRFMALDQIPRDTHISLLRGGFNPLPRLIIDIDFSSLHPLGVCFSL